VGLIGYLLGFTRRSDNVSDVKSDPGGGANVTAPHFGAPGDDGHPLPGDSVALIGVPRTGGVASVGYIDPANTPKAAAGERRVYSRDASGAVVAEVWLKNTGEVSVKNDAGEIKLAPAGDFEYTGPIGALTFTAAGMATISNTLGSIVLDPGGSVTINGTTFGVGGTMTSTGTITGQDVQTTAGVDLGTHTHGGVDPGSGNTSGPN